ncbi:hypothetical protein IJJ97_06690 [bacterium]|nr:hypothetical protein [bacterium]
MAKKQELSELQRRINTKLGGEYLDEAKELFKTGEEDKANELLKKAINLRGNQNRSYACFLQSQHMEDLSKAITICEELLLQMNPYDPFNYDIKKHLGNLYLKVSEKTHSSVIRREYEGDAVRYFLQALQVNPNDYETIIKVAETFDKIGEVQGAMYITQRAIDIAPNLPTAYEIRARVINNHYGDFHNAVFTLREFIKTNNATSSTYITLGDIYKMNGWFEHAEYYYKKAFEDKITDDIIKVNFFMILLANGKKDEANKLLSEVSLDEIYLKTCQCISEIYTSSTSDDLEETIKNFLYSNNYKLYEDLLGDIINQIAKEKQDDKELYFLTGLLYEKSYDTCKKDYLKTKAKKAFNKSENQEYILKYATKKEYRAITGTDRTYSYNRRKKNKESK